MPGYPTQDPSALGALDRGFTAWTYDPMFGTGPSVPAAGTPLYTLFKWPGGLLTNIHFSSSNPLITGTAGQNFMGIYNVSGARLVQSADQTANWGGAGTGNGQYVTPLIVPTYLAAGLYFHGFLQNHAGVGLSMTRLSANTQALWSGLGAALGVPRAALGAGGQVALPANIGGFASTALPFWWAFT